MADPARIGVASWTGLALLGALLAAGCGGGEPPATTWKQSANMPADFPKDLPIYPGATLKHAVTPEQGSGMVVIWETPDKLSAVQGQLIKELEAQGWTVSVLPGVAAKWLGDGGVTVVATRWGRQVSLTLGAKPETTAITVVIPWRP